MPETRINEAELEQFKHRLVRLRAELQNLKESSKKRQGPEPGCSDELLVIVFS